MLMDKGHDNGNDPKGVVGAVSRLGTGIIRALPSGFLTLVLMICFILWMIRDLNSERIEAMKMFALSCTEALMKSQPGR